MTIRHRSRAAGLAPLLFATSNVAKFLQACMVLSSAGFEVQRLEAHRRPYAEPYGRPTPEFLKAGVEEVVARAGHMRLVFIEDTTAHFPSLSRDGEEFPGQRTKEWFAETSHGSLLRSLEQAGGDRSVIVRSDIALYVPGLRIPVLFSASTSGSVAENVEEMEPNPLYPWLGQSDFSSWFIPSGAMNVLAAMQIHESLRYDFRAKALSKLAERLAEYVAVFRLPAVSIQRPSISTSINPAQLGLLPEAESDIVLVVVGSMSAGKTTVGHFLALHRNFRHVEGSRALVDAAHNLGISNSNSYFELADALFETHGFDAVEREIVIPLLEETEGSLVYTGCRTIEGLSALKEAAERLGKSFRVLYLSTTSSLRLTRAIERARGGLPIDPLRFDQACQRDEAYGAAIYGRLISDARVTNETELEPFLAKIDDIVNQLRRGDRRISRRRLELGAQVARARSSEELCAALGRTSPDLVNRLGPQARLTGRGSALLSLL